MPLKSSAEHCEAAALVLRQLSSTRVCALEAATGWAKSTTLIGELLSQDSRGVFVVTQPRRMAARALARRLTATGTPAGYIIAGENTSTPDTKVIYVTLGLVPRMLPKWKHDRFVLVIDECHETQEELEVVFAVAHHLHRTGGKVLFLSASMPERVTVHFAVKPLQYTQRRYGLEVKYVGYLKSDRREAVMKLIESIKDEDWSDILVFVSGVAEALSLTTAINQQRFLHAIPLYSGQASEDQDAAFADAPPRCRKVVVATDVAETSITIPNVTVVIDTMMKRSVSWEAGKTRTSLIPISKMSANQRSM